MTCCRPSDAWLLITCHAVQVLKDYQITKFIPFNPVDKKTQATVIMPSGEKLMACKGAPQVGPQC